MDKVKHWPSWANWYARQEDGRAAFFVNSPSQSIEVDGSGYWGSRGMRITAQKSLELVEIDPQTPWQDSKQRRPD